MPVFGILERAGRVDTVAVPNCTKETLVAKIEAATVEGSVFYTDEFASDNDVKSRGEPVPINHQETFGAGAAHINGTEGFWSFAKRLYRHVHGVDPRNFPLDLAEYAFRYNHRGEHLMTLHYDHLIRATVPTHTVPWNFANHLISHYQRLHRPALRPRRGVQPPGFNFKTNAAEGDDLPGSADESTLPDFVTRSGGLKAPPMRARPPALNSR